MPRIAVELTNEEFTELKKLAKEQKRTPKAQIEWFVAGELGRRGKIPVLELQSESSTPSDAEYAERIMKDPDHRRVASCE